MQHDIFDTLDEVAQVLNPGAWVLVGGLMVHAHSVLAGVTNPRPTNDADIVLEVAVMHYADAAAALARIGFAPREPLDHREPSYRFTRGTEHLDLMVPDRTDHPVRFRQRDVLAATGAASALRRTTGFSTPTGRQIRIPDVSAALSLKGAAYRTPSADPGRHLRDGVILFACAAGSEELEPPSRSMRTNINQLLSGLSELEPWTGIAASSAARAVRGIRLHYRPDWSPPEGVLPQRPRPRT